MPWGSTITSDVLTLGAAFATVQASAADMAVILSPQETAHVQLDFDPQATPTENCLVIVAASADETSYDTDEHPYMSAVLLKDEDPARLSIPITGVRAFKVKARLIDTDGTDGGDDTTSTLTVRYRKDGVAA